MTEQQLPTDILAENTALDEATIPPEADIFAEDAALDEAVIPPETEIEESTEPAEDFFEDEEPVRRSRGFRIGFGIFTVLLLAAVAVALWFFQNALVKYESGVDEPPLQAYMELIKNEDYETLFAASGFQTTELNDKEDYIAYLRTLYADAEELSVVKQVTAEDEVQRYNLYSNGKEKLATRLVTSEVGKDGKTTWYVTTELSYQPTYTVTASDDIDLYINGKPVDFLSSDTVTVTEMQSTVFDFATDIPLPAIKTYTINGLLLPPEIEATGLSGNTCVRHEEGRNILLMLADDEYERSLHETLATDFVAAHFTAGTDNLHEVTVSNYCRYSESDFSCTVKCMEVTTSDNGIISVGDTAVTYDLTFLKSEDTWVLCSLVIDGVEQPLPEPPAED